jgi:hypothetical protein
LPRPKGAAGSQKETEKNINILIRTVQDILRGLPRNSGRFKLN